MAKEKSRRMAENNIPYKVRAALLLVPLNLQRAVHMGGCV